MNKRRSSFSDELWRCLWLFRRWAWLIAATSLLAGGAACIFSLLMKPVYASSTLIMINESPTTKSVDYTSILVSERLARTYAEVMATGPVLEGVIRRLELPMTADDLLEKIEVQPVRDTQLIQVRVEDTDPVRAAQIANSLVEEFSRQHANDQAARFTAARQALESQTDQLGRKIRDTIASVAELAEEKDALAERESLEASLYQYHQTYNVLVQSYEQLRLAEAQATAAIIQKEPAVPHLKSIRPRILINVIFGSAFGLFLSLAAVFLVEALDDHAGQPAPSLHVAGFDRAQPAWRERGDPGGGFARGRSARLPGPGGNRRRRQGPGSRAQGW